MSSININNGEVIIDDKRYVPEDKLQITNRLATNYLNGQSVQTVMNIFEEVVKNKLDELGYVDLSDMMHRSGTDSDYFNAKKLLLIHTSINV